MLAMDTIGSRLRHARELAGVSRDDLATAMGIAVTTLADLETDRSKSTTKLHHAATRLGVSLQWLETGKGPMEAKRDDNDGFAYVRASNQRASMGGGAEGEPYAEAHKLKFRAESLARKRLSAKNLKVYYGAGDSMESTLFDGDAIMYDTSDRKPVDDEIFVIWYDNRLMVKRLRVIDDIVLIVSDNPVGKWRQQIRVKPKDMFEIEGKVKWIARWIQC